MTESHWELGHILSIGSSGGRWHIPREQAPNTGLCGKFGYRQGDRPSREFQTSIDSIVELGTAPMCYTCAHIRMGK